MIRKTAVAIVSLGIGIAARSLPPWSLAAAGGFSLSPAHAAFGVLGLGLLFGLRHATDADHVAAVGTLVSEQGSLRRALWTGCLWGAGHTVSILIAGLLVLGLHLVIPERIARALEFGVALMIIGLGGTVLARALRNRPDIHVHRHSHGPLGHRHLHFHGPDDRHLPGVPERENSSPDSAAGGPPDPHRDHTLAKMGVKPFLVGMMHGLAGSAALTLLVLARIQSPILGMVYLLVFGAGSIGGMALMSLALVLPFAATASRLGVNHAIRVAAGVLSVAFGLLYAWSHWGSGPGS